MELIEIAEGILVAQREATGFGAANSAAIVEDDGITVVDACTVPAHAREFADALATTGIPIRHLVYTSPHVDHVGGSSAYPLAAAYCHLAPELATDFSGLTTRPVSHTVREAAWISSRVVIAPTHGQTSENLVVQIPDANTVIAGAMASFGVIPPAWAGDPAAWADQLDVVLGWGATVVPSHGPVGGEPEVRSLQAYLRALTEAGTTATMPDGVWTTWTNQRFHAANLERAAMLAAGDTNPPPTILQLMGIA